MSWSVAVCWSVAVAQQMPPRDVVKRASGVASVSGRITEEGTGRPLPRMRVELRGRDSSREPIETVTDADGRYAFDGVPPGAYYLTAGPGEYRTGHLSKAYMLDDLPMGVAPLNLKAGDMRPGVDVALPRTFAIEGRVVNEFGEPLSDVWMSAEPMKAAASSYRSFNTDDRGQFRFWGLGVGTWRVCAESRNQGFDRVTDPAVLQNRLARTCVPSGAAAPLVLTDGDVTGIVIQMQRARAYTLSGRIVLESGVVPERASVMVRRIEPDTLSRGGSSDITVEYEAGRFVARGLVPGEYGVRAMIMKGDAWEPMSSRDLGIERVRIDSGDVENVLVVMHRGADIAGRISFEVDPAFSPAGLRLRVHTSRGSLGDMDQLWALPTPSANVNDDLTFSLSALHGPLTLGVTGLPRDWTVKEVRYGGKDVVEIPTEFARGAQDVHIVVTNRTAHVSARAVDAAGQLVAKAMPVLVPAEESRWRSIRTPFGPSGPAAAGDGTMQIGPVRPGDYLLAAVSAQDLSRLHRSPRLVMALLERAHRLTLKAGDHPRLDVQVVALPAGQ